jgi:hypothetical protein
MSIMRLIAPFAQGSGKVVAAGQQAATGGIVMMPDANGRTLTRSYVVPQQPETAYQAQQIANFTAVSEAMQSLSQPQVEAWQALAVELRESGRLGLDFSLSWTMLFSRVNNYRLLMGLSTVLDPPAITNTSAPSGVTSITSDDGDPAQELTITVTEAGTPPTGTFLAYRLTRNLVSAARQARTNELRYPADTDDCFLPRDTTNPYVYTLPCDRLNILSTQRIGLEIVAVTAEGVPGSRLFVKNILVGATP